MGFAIGMDSPVAFTFIAEISNLKHKEEMLTIGKSFGMLQ